MCDSLNVSSVLNDLVFIGYYGYGHYSDSESYAGILCSKSDADYILDGYFEDEYSFGELDGKHSEVAGDFYETDDIGEILTMINNFEVSKCGLNFDGSEVIKHEDGIDEDRVNNILKLNDYIGNLSIETIKAFEITDGDEVVKIMDN